MSLNDTGTKECLNRLSLHKETETCTFSLRALVSIRPIHGNSFVSCMSDDSLVEHLLRGKGVWPIILPANLTRLRICDLDLTFKKSRGADEFWHRQWLPVSASWSRCQYECLGTWSHLINATTMYGHWASITNWFGVKQYFRCCTGVNVSLLAVAPVHKPVHSISVDGWPYHLNTLHHIG